MDNEELLTCWSLGQLPPSDHTALIEHLSQCAACRSRLAELLRAGVLTLPEPASVPEEEPAAGPAVLRLRPRRLRRRLIVAVAAAAAVLLALAWLALPRGNRGDPAQAELARAEQELEAGEIAAALARLEELDREEIEPDTRARTRRLLEQAAYQLARRRLEDSQLAQVADIAQRAAHHGVRSARLVNLELQAERGIPAETALAQAWSLPTYGYELDGTSFAKALPEVDARNKRINEAMEKAIKDHPKDATLLVNHGQFLLSLGHLDTARKRFEQALALDTSRVAAHLGLGLVAFQEDKYPEALKHFQNALAIDRDNTPGHLNAAICLEQLKKPEEARTHRHRVLELTRDAELRRQIKDYEAGKAPGR
jgi:tetratricopeptide (TPR) repeat protein